VVIAVLEAVKRMFPDLDKRWLPLLGLACSAVVQAIGIYVAQTAPRDAVGYALLAALVAVGAYSSVRATLGQ
jgi:hypothetical protein